MWDDHIHISVPRFKVLVLDLLLIQFTANAHLGRETAYDSSSTWVPVTHMETWNETLSCCRHLGSVSVSRSVSDFPTNKTIKPQALVVTLDLVSGVF